MKLEAPIIYDAVTVPFEKGTWSSQVEGAEGMTSSLYRWSRGAMG
jgi:hypothetical protein